MMKPNRRLLIDETITIRMRIPTLGALNSQYGAANAVTAVNKKFVDKLQTIYRTEGRNR
ncbi:hypothetical protein IMCC3135_14380 [Granulosicoccus antarcticus IMCC3135]|uniref:Uncharacterized protein n=1 Tax=Granulosicoccus antarcticus IMCC3135 TaxID=1192854 RepID=A0A2Z2NSH1_9GAMM|nr:hypothetical protein IMCC3135_14380 [Granulosicoccus antarcticus IMCC3135]